MMSMKSTCTHQYDTGSMIPWKPVSEFPLIAKKRMSIEGVRSLAPAQLRELIGNIIENVDHAGELAIAFVEQKHLDFKVMRKLSGLPGSMEEDAVRVCLSPANLINEGAMHGRD